MSKPENPPLFTGIYSGGGPQEYSTDITLRDLFAAAALVGMFANSNYDASSLDFARMAYDDADAMLAGREEGK